MSFLTEINKNLQNTLSKLFMETPERKVHKHASHQ